MSTIFNNSLDFLIVELGHKTNLIYIWVTFIKLNYISISYEFLNLDLPIHLVIEKLENLDNFFSQSIL